jgi:hypothetical protein
MVTEVVFTPAHVLAEAIRRREVSSVEIVDAYLAQIARHNPQLNAIVTLDDEGARVKAQEAEAALGRGEVWGTLHGVPITLEDAHPTSGMRSKWGGVPRLAEHVPAQDGTIANRLKEGGDHPAGQDQRPGDLARLGVRSHQQPLGSHAYSGRLERRCWRRAGRRTDTLRYRTGYLGVDPESGSLLLRLRHASY